MRRIISVFSVLMIATLTFAQGALTAGDADSIFALNALGSGQAESVAFSPNGKLMLVGSTVGAFLLETGAPTSRLDALDGRSFPASHVAFSPDGRLAAASGLDYAVRVWDVETGAELWNAYPDADFPTRVAFGATSERLYIADASGNVSVFDTAGESLLRFEDTGGEALVNALALQGDVVVTGDTDGAVRVYNGQTGALLNTLTTHQGGVGGLALTTDADRVISVGWDDQTLNVSDLNTGTLIRTESFDVLEGTEVTALALSPDGTQFVLSVYDGLLLGSTALDSELLLLEGEQLGLLDAVFSPDGRSVASVSGDLLIIRDLSGGDVVTSVPFSFGFTGLALSSDGAFAVVTDEVGGLTAFDLTGSDQFLPLVNDADAVHVIFNADGTRIITASSEASLSTWDLNGQLMSTVTLESSAGALVRLPGGGFAAGLDDGQLLAWRADLSDTPDARLASPTGEPITALSASADGQWLLAGDSEGHLTAWEPFGSAEPVRWDSFDGAVTATGISADRAFLVVGTANGALTLWARDPANPDGYLAQPALEGHDGGITSAAFSPDASLLATSASDGRFTLWNTATGARLSDFYAHNADVTGLAFSPDGRRIWSVGMDGSLRTFGKP
jgi:WD40 repeat protein